MAVVAGICWAIGTTFFRQGMQDLNFTTVNQVRIPLMAVLMLAIGPVIGRPVRVKAYGRRTFGMIALVGLLGMGFGSLLFLFSLQDLGATRAALIGALSPFFGVPLAAVFLSEKITRRRVLGMILCVAAVWLVLNPISA
jgi:drug/metabolite transporter (DMT)-like permease